MIERAALPPGLRQLASVLTDALDGLTERAIALDPVAAARIAALDGRVLAIEAGLPAWPGLAPDALRFNVVFEHGSLRVRPAAEDDPAAHARVCGPLPTLIAWLAGPRAALSPDLRLEGDLQLIEVVGALASGYRPDLTTSVGRIVGPDVANSLLNAVEAASAGLGVMRNLFRDTAAGGARQVFSDRALAEQFLNALDALRTDVDRLAARVEHAESRHSSSTPTTGGAVDDAGRPMP
jgi:ubiquinone biosynthesis protein UbiJ